MKKKKEKLQFFNAFVSDSIIRLKKGETILCFHKDQVEEVIKEVDCVVSYDENNRWWILSKKKEEK